jgi:flagellar hook-length control protein FliK
MRQVSDGITRSGGGEIELRLSPEELGRIQMKLTNGEHGLMVHIQAERSETLDLLRRNIGDLAQDLADAGYEGAGFTFGDERPQSGEPVQIASDAGPEASAPEIQVVASSLPPSRDGIDIRI